MSLFYSINRYFLSKYLIIYNFCKNISFYNKNYILNKIIGFNLSKAILLLSIFILFFNTFIDKNN